MMKKKLKITSLSLESFITSFSGLNIGKGTDRIRGGIIPWDPIDPGDKSIPDTGDSIPTGIAQCYPES